MISYKDECTFKQLDDYDQAQRDAANSLSRGIAKLGIRNLEDDVTEDEIKDNKEKIADLTLDLALHKAKVAAFDARRAQIEPPTPEQLDSLRENLDKVNSLTLSRTLASEVVKFTTDSLNTIKEIQPD